MIAWILFYNPVTVSSGLGLWLILPLCAGVAVVYKTIRTTDLSRLWLETLTLIGLITAALFALGAALWIVQKYLM